MKTDSADGRLAVIRLGLGLGFHGSAAWNADVGFTSSATHGLATGIAGNGKHGAAGKVRTQKSYDISHDQILQDATRMPPTKSASIRGIDRDAESLNLRTTQIAGFGPNMTMAGKAISGTVKR